MTGILLNAQNYAGTNYSFDIEKNIPLKNNKTLSAEKKAILAKLHVDYPNGVDFDIYGFPRFEKYTVEIGGRKAIYKGKTTGVRETDFKLADEKFGITEKYRKENKFVWHHVEDTETMILLSSALHNNVRHCGGISVHKNEIIDESLE